MATTMTETEMMTEAATGATAEATAEGILDSEKEYEIVAGRAEEKIMGGMKQGGAAIRLAARLWDHVRSRSLGGVYGPDTSYKIGSNTRIPDVSFIAIERLLGGEEPVGPSPAAPDLAIEVISPTDVFVKVRDKIHEYLAAGVKQAWIVEPDAATVTIYRSPTDPTMFAGEDELICEDLLPGFRLPLGEIVRLRAEAPEESKQ